MQCPKCGYKDDAFYIGVIGVIGDGSAGQRHARMLKERGYIVDICGEKHTGHPYDFYAVVIASPPSTHAEFIDTYWKVPMLCEGPVTCVPEHPLHNVPPRMTAENWLFVPQVQRLVEKCTCPFPPKVVHAHLYFDYDLARWRGSGWDYKTSCYYTSGIDNINVHEVMVALALFGPAAEVCVHRTHTGKSLVFDAFTMSIKHKSGVLCTINSSWHSAIYRRGVQVFYEDGSMDELSWTSPQDDTIANQSYAAMLDHWLECIRTGAEPSPSLYDGFRAYKLLQGVCL